MRIVYLADIRFPMERANGIQTIETCHGLARHGAEVELVVQRRDERSDEECLDFFGLRPHPNLTLRRISIPSPGSTLGKLAYMVKAFPSLSPKRFDAIYTRDLILADAALRLKFLHRLPVLYEAHTAAAAFAEEASVLYGRSKPPGAAKMRRLSRREERVCRGISALVTITEGLRKCFEELYPETASIEVIADGARIPDEIPPLRARSAEDDFRLYYVGQLYPWKGVETLIEAVREVPKVRLVIVGGLPPEPDLDRLKNLSEKLGTTGKVSFRGYLPPAQVAEERSKADGFAIPLVSSKTARHFTSPLKLFEAMASGRPIIASNLPSIREVLTDGVNAMLVEPDDPRALGSAMETLRRDPELGRRLADQAARDVRAYSWDERARKLAQLLNTVKS
jgi:glycosyltransferase involved in cell wall biosynthesis